MTPQKRSDLVHLALPKGRIQDGVFRLLSEAGIHVRIGARGYRPTLSIEGFETKLLKPQNIVEMLAAGSRDVGFAGADWVAGFYRVDASTALDRCVGLTIVYVVEEVDPNFFMPSGRSMAFTKSAWRQAGGFPEDAEFGEDTLFDEMMLDAGFHPVFAPEAIVAWHPPSGLEGLARTTFRWGRGDGAAHLRGAYYKRTLAAYAAGLGLAALLAVAKPKLIPLAVLPVAKPVWRSSRYKFRHEASPAKYAYLPLARVIATTSNLAGFLVGRYVGE